MEARRNQEGGVERRRESSLVYFQEKLQKAERRLTQESVCNSRAHRRMNRGFFQTLTPKERKQGGDHPGGGGRQ